jgi:predicted unusual protein kinase regulating ubiquinone biosynthesis (AarF/ABC1/UbiB family)
MRQRYIEIVALSSVPIYRRARDAAHGRSVGPPGPYAGSVADTPPPTSRIARTRRFGGLVAGQSLRWAGTRAANALRSDEAADAATGERAAATARELVKQLGQMRGAAMKIGQVLSTVDFTAIPESEREEFKETLASLRDDVPPLPFNRVEKLLKEELGERPAAVFADFEQEAFAAASIGQVHRATTKAGAKVAVKVQYPGIAEAVDTDLRNLQLLLPLVKRLAPGLDVKALADELRERISEELDYEIEAQNHRAMARAWGGHPFVHVPAVDTELSHRRVLVTELLAGRRFEAVKALPEPERDRFGEIVFRFFFGSLKQLRRASGDPHPGNYLLLDDDRVGFLDFGLMRTVDADYLEGERALARSVRYGDAEATHAGLAELGYLPRPETFDPQKLLDQIRTAGEWYLEPGFRRLTPGYVTDLLDRSGSPRSPFFEQMRRETVPPQALLMRRMEGLVFSTLGELRAGADWAALGSEYWGDAPPTTPLGEADAAFWAAARGA